MFNFDYKKVILGGVSLTILVSMGLYSYSAVISKSMAEDLKEFEARSFQKEQDSKKVEKKAFGLSTKGRSIDGYEIGSGKNTILMFGSIHGNEMGAAYLLERYIEEIKVDPNIISRTKKLVIIPIINPDGYYDRTDKLNANGVNLDLNFPTSDWQEYGPRGTWAGPQPLSEPESRILKQIVEQYEPNAMISYHARGAFVTPEIANTPSELGKWYAEKTGYIYDDEIDEWNFPGTATKWFVETTGKPAITVELTKYLESDWDINKEAMLELVSSLSPLPST